jgi:hypothetical protein
MIKMKQANPGIVGKPIPEDVRKAIKIIQKYLKKGWWAEAIISSDGGASFHLDSILKISIKDIYKMIPEIECENCGWQGDTNERIDGCCPECGETNSIVDYEGEGDEIAEEENG